MTRQVMCDFGDNYTPSLNQQLELPDAHSWVAPAMAGLCGIPFTVSQFHDG